MGLLSHCSPQPHEPGRLFALVWQRYLPDVIFDRCRPMLCLPDISYLQGCEHWAVIVMVLYLYPLYLIFLFYPFPWNSPMARTYSRLLAPTDCMSTHIPLAYSKPFIPSHSVAFHKGHYPNIKVQGRKLLTVRLSGTGKNCKNFRRKGLKSAYFN